MAVAENGEEESGPAKPSHARRLAPALLCAAPPVGLDSPTAAASSHFKAEDGRVLQDVYDLGRELGGGASSTVYLATDRRTKEQRALKVLHRAPFDDEYMTAQYEAYKEATEAFHTEMKVLRAVDHPHIVRLYDAFQSQSGFVVAMEFCPGGGLLNYLETAEYFGEDSTAAAIRQICSAVAHLHSLKIVHCDLKPENILVSGQTSTSEKHSCPLLKLADFGVAVFKGDKAVSVGASGYAAPEVMGGDPCDELGDMWSLGMVALVLLSGVNPATARRALIFGQPPALPEGASVAAADFASWCLNPVPAERCTAPQALAHDWLTSEVPSVGLPTLSESMRQLKQFSRLSRVHRAVMQIVAYAMPAEQIAELSAVFEMLDKDQDGELSPQELQEGLRRIDPECKHYDAVFDALDFDHTHVIHYNEFVAACLGRKRYLQREALWRAFCAIDTEGKGEISLENLREAFCGSMEHEHFSEARIRQAFDDMDTDHNGRVSFSEFHKMMARGGIYARSLSCNGPGRQLSSLSLTRLMSSTDLDGSPTTVRSAASAPAAFLVDAFPGEESTPRGAVTPTTIGGDAMEDWTPLAAATPTAIGGDAMAEDAFGVVSAADEPQAVVEDAQEPAAAAPGPSPSSPLIAALLEGNAAHLRPRRRDSREPVAAAPGPSPSSPLIATLLEGSAAQPPQRHARAGTLRPPAAGTPAPRSPVITALLAEVEAAERAAEEESAAKRRRLGPSAEGGDASEEVA